MTPEALARLTEAGAVTPDEQVYIAQAAMFRKGGFAALRDLADEFVEDDRLQRCPSPLRWLWAVVTSVLPGNHLQFVTSLILAPLAYWAFGGVWWWAPALAASSPLVFSLSRRFLQDVPVAALTLLALGFSFHHSTVALAIVVAVLLSVKEGAIFALPAIGAAWGGVAVLPPLLAGVEMWAICLMGIFGPRRTLAVFRTAARGHDTSYTRKSQKGAPHRLFFDLFLLSPVACVFAVLGATHAPHLALVTLVLVAAHALAPVRNVRLIVAADVLIRLLAVAGMGAPLFEIPFALAVDAFIAWKLRKFYDPTTANLTAVLGMS